LLTGRDAAEEKGLGENQDVACHFTLLRTAGYAQAGPGGPMSGGAKF